MHGTLVIKIAANSHHTCAILEIGMERIENILRETQR